MLNVHGKDWCWNWSSNTLATWCGELIHWKGPWCWERLKAGGEGGNREWDDWMASLTQWVWVWANSGRWWRTGKSGVLQSMGLQRVRHDWAPPRWQHPVCTGLCQSPAPTFIYTKAVVPSVPWEGKKSHSMPESALALLPKSLGIHSLYRDFPTQGHTFLAGRGTLLPNS